MGGLFHNINNCNMGRKVQKISLMDRLYSFCMPCWIDYRKQNLNNFIEFLGFKEIDNNKINKNS